MLPDKANIMRINQTIESSGFMDRLFIHVYSEEENPELLTNYADSLTNILNNSPDSGLIRELEYKLSEEQENKIFSFVQDHLPLLLEESDYDSIADRLTKENIDQSVTNGYQLLMTPAGAWSAPLFLKDPLNLTSLGLNKLAQLKLDDNIEVYQGYFLSRDHKHLLMWVIPKNEPNETTENAQLLSSIDSSLAVLNSANVRGEYFGTTAVAVGNAQRIKSDIQTTVAIAFTLLLIFLTTYFRKIATILYLFTPMLFGGLFALSVLYLYKGTISAISLGIGSMIVGITIDFSLHFLNHFKEENDTRAVLSATIRPILTSCLTTASAFLCLTLVKSDALTDLGLFAGLSVIGAAFATLIVLSQVIKPFKTNPEKPKGDILSKIGKYPIHNNFIVLGSVVVITIICLFFFKNVRFDGDMQKMNYLSDELGAAQTRLSAINGYSEKTVYLIAQGASKEEALRNNLEVGKSLNTLKDKFSTLEFANSSVLLLPEEEQNKRRQRWKTFWTDARVRRTMDALAASGEQYKFKPTAFKRFPLFIWSNFQPYTLDDLLELKALNVGAFIGEKDGLHVVFNPLRIKDEPIKEVKEYLNQKEVFVFDKAAFTNSIVTSLQKDFSSLIWASLLAVFIILILFFRHTLLAFLTLLPVVISWVWVTGIMSMFNIQFNIFNIIVSSLVFGLGIDYAIFITSGLLHELKTGERKVSIYKVSILLSALTTVCGVGALILAKHPALYSMAFISILGIGIAVLISFTLQTFLIRTLIVNRSQRGVEPYTTYTLINTILTFSFFVLGCIIAFIMGYLILPLIPVKKKFKKQLVNWYSSKWLRIITASQVQIPQTLKFPSKERFAKPSIIIANHESFLDILVLLGMYPKNILVTNDWVYNSPFFGKVVQYIGFYPVSKGIDDALPHLKKKIEDGYNICIFPEGTRSTTPALSRFHKGAFYIAQELQLDIVPIILHGYGQTLSKGDDFIVKNSQLVQVLTLPTIKHNDLSWGENGRERYKSISRYFKKEFYQVRQDYEHVNFYKRQLLNNYLYKGNDLEKECRSILNTHHHVFDAINNFLPDKCKSLVIGDRLGLLAMFLTYRNAKRLVTGLFKNENELKIASNCFSFNKNEQSNLQLMQNDVDYSNLEYVIICAELVQLEQEDLNFIVNEAYGKMNDSCSLILAQFKQLPELVESEREQVGEDLVIIKKKIG
tara:strand:- start:1749 stop:5321 length:3573 start_codon:yes stop_codon:yes gene_type:complete